MAIAKMSKFDIILFEDDRKNLLDKLQDFDYVHFNNLSDSMDEEELEALQTFDCRDEIDEIEERLKNIDWAIKKIESFKGKKSLSEKLKTKIPRMTFNEIKKDGEDIDADAIISDVRDLANIIENSQERIEEIASGKNITYITGSMPIDNIPLLVEYVDELKHSTLDFLNEEGTNQYFNIITNNSEESGLNRKLSELGFMSLEDILKRFDLSDEEVVLVNSLKDQDQGLEKISKDLREKRDIALKNLQGKEDEYIKDLKVSYEYNDNRKNLLEGNEKFLSIRSLSFIQGYIPSKKEDDFKKLLSKEIKEEYVLEIKDADKDDPNVPIILENNKLVKPFESIVKTYSMPKYYEVDPTPTVMPFYAIFFGFMMGDFGYGLLLFLATTLALKFIDLRKSTKSSLKFFQILSIPTMIAGLIYGSFFGDLIPIPGLINTSTDYMIMLYASVALGFIHLLFGLGVKGYMLVRDGKYSDLLFDVVSWYMVLIGGVGFLLSSMIEMSPIISTISLILFILGLIIVLLFSHRDEKSLFGRIAWGFYDVYGITSYLGDLISYTRVAALALSGAYIGLAVNMIANMMIDASVVGIPFAIIVIVVFHLFNMFLSALSGYVHSMRLIYVEYYGEFYEGGGVPFRKLQNEGKYIELLDKEK